MMVIVYIYNYMGDNILFISLINLLRVYEREYGTFLITFRSCNTANIVFLISMESFVTGNKQSYKLLPYQFSYKI